MFAQQMIQKNPDPFGHRQRDSQGPGKGKMDTLTAEGFQFIENSYYVEGKNPTDNSAALTNASVVG